MPSPPDSADEDSGSEPSQDLPADDEVVEDPPSNDVPPDTNDGIQVDGSHEDQIPLSISKEDAFRFLNQATMGATEDAAIQLRSLGYEAWIETQLRAGPSLQLPYLQALQIAEHIARLNADRLDIWFRNALHGEDQLRQRVAFALSEILVVAEVGQVASMPYALASYYDMLVRQAFGNFRDLLEEATLHPAMGVFLSMLGNQKPNAQLNILPDENYARELLQLFTIGLIELELDGSAKLDTYGVPIPTYNQDLIEGFAHVFTGWHFAGARNFLDATDSAENQILPMELYTEFHATGPKRILNDTILPAGQSGRKDLADALDNIFYHPNVGPFLAHRLIQRLVTSNPSPAYISRIARRFDDNGYGIRGDLGAVIKAILLDPEARAPDDPEKSGKIKEPLLRLTQLWRAYRARPADGRSYGTRSVFRERLGQGPLQAPSVFNFFSPSYAPPGELAQIGTVAPELEIATEYQTAMLANYLFRQCFRGNSGLGGAQDRKVVLDIEEEMSIADDVEALVDRVATKLLDGRATSLLRDEAVSLASTVPDSDPATRVAEVIFIICISPEFVLQR